MIITAGIYKGRKITAPDEKITRPTLSKTRMGVFNTLYSILGSFENKTFLDVFGGSGIMGLEAISRGFKFVTVYEKNRKVAQIIKKNYTSLGIEPNLLIGDSCVLIKKNDTLYDVAYIDPPYASGDYEHIINNVNASIIAIEHDVSRDFSHYDVIKTKNYGGNFVTYIKRAF